MYIVFVVIVVFVVFKSVFFLSLLDENIYFFIREKNIGRDNGVVDDRFIVEKRNNCLDLFRSILENIEEEK